ncbi:LOW QUALITY PROTEIN: hypothetical protein CRUP_011239 [Coryphaenoides rupestris]|nr:LOW QUALITY PROTEIN: hypothetical protein CRUP_011239 [Coryphaenoides rupestris]
MCSSPLSGNAGRERLMYDEREEEETKPMDSRGRLQRLNRSTQQVLRMSRRVAVIGAGSSGLVCIKTCLEEGLDPVCFESSHDIGGLWRFKENPEPDRASIYHSFPNYMHHSLIIEYFRAYAEHFQLTKHIRFQWDVETESSEGNRQKHIFDAVMVCIGHHCQPNLPLHDFPRGKKVVVIGIGNSGGDIAVELSRVTKQLEKGGLPTDMSFNRVFNFVIWLLPFNFLCSLGESRLNMRFNHRLYNLQPKHSAPVSCHRRSSRVQSRTQPKLPHPTPTVNDELPNRVLSGTVQIKPNIRRFQAPAWSVCHRLQLLLPFLSSSVLPVSGNKASLYKYVFPPALDRNTLAVIGLVQPLGANHAHLGDTGALGTARLQRVRSPSGHLLTSPGVPPELKLTPSPCGSCRLCPVSRVLRHDAGCPVQAGGHGEKLGVRPSMLRLLLTDPRLAHSVILGPATPYPVPPAGAGPLGRGPPGHPDPVGPGGRPMKTNECSLPEPRGSAGGLWVLLSAGVLAVASYYHRSSLASLLQEPGSLAGDLVARVEGLLPAWGGA